MYTHAQSAVYGTLLHVRTCQVHDRRNVIVVLRETRQLQTAIASVPSRTPCNRDSERSQ